MGRTTKRIGSQGEQKPVKTLPLLPPKEGKNWSGHEMMVSVTLDLDGEKVALRFHPVILDRLKKEANTKHITLEQWITQKVYVSGIVDGVVGRSKEIVKITPIKEQKP